VNLARIVSALRNCAHVTDYAFGPQGSFDVLIRFSVQYFYGLQPGWEDPGVEGCIGVGDSGRGYTSARIW
jgi:hypothetical protein